MSKLPRLVKKKYAGGSSTFGSVSMADMADCFICTTISRWGKNVYICG
ncbi:MAG: hypothetical protein KDC16_10235 [Saprospiraceae bacterium]|nr:hypothetical protein [Saprospiraceae bacterium]